MDYVRIYNLSIKDNLPTGNSGKVIKGTELDTELNAVAAAIASKGDTNSPTLTGTPLAPTATYGTNTQQIATTAFVQQALQAMYPIGSVYINASSATNPSSLLGFGTWVAIGEGQVLVGQKTTDTSFDTLGETGGSKDAIVVSHTHGVTTISGTAASSGAHTHTITDPGHTHSATGGSTTGGPGGGGGYVWVSPNYNVSSSTTGITINSSGAHTHTVSLTGNTDSTGSSGTNANLQPYVVVKMWQRTA